MTLDHLSGKGLLGLFLNVVAEQFGAPLPAEPSLIVAGSLAATGRLRLPALYSAAIGGVVVADAVWYLLGRRFGRPLLALVSRLFRAREVPLGFKSLALAKFLPGAGLIVPPLAGAMHYGFRRFVAYDLLAAAIWSSLWIGAGLTFHDQVERVLRALDELLVPMVVVAAAAALGFAVWKARIPLSRFVRRLGSG
jgi:membrane protein DedA with SNARE-associated domain